MKKLIVLIIVIFASLNLAEAQILPIIEKVKEIKLLESNRDEVIRILSAYKFESGEKYHYDHFNTGDFDISVEYSDGNCEEFRVDGFNVPEWRAIQIEIEPNNPIKLEDLKIDFLKYKKEKKYYDRDDVYVYYDKESGIIFTVEDGELESVELIPSPKYYGLMCDKKKAKKLSKTASIFEDKLKDRRGIPHDPPNLPANVTRVDLSQSKIIINCDLADSNEIKSCSESSKIIEVSTIAFDPEDDVTTYLYTVSAGKITGKGKKVLWDLSGVKPGTYKITVAVDDGCGFCGKTMTKTVVVKECSNCKQN